MSAQVMRITSKHIFDISIEGGVTAAFYSSRVIKIELLRL